jgi:hypothetical protein
MEVKSASSIELTSLIAKQRGLPMWLLKDVVGTKWLCPSRASKPAQCQADGSAPANLVRILNEGHEITTIGDEPNERLFYLHDTKGTANLAGQIRPRSVLVCCEIHRSATAAISRLFFSRKEKMSITANTNLPELDSVCLHSTLA